MRRTILLAVLAALVAAAPAEARKGDAWATVNVCDTAANPNNPDPRQWVGWVEGDPVACSAAWVEHGINNVTLVATVPDARRRGYGEALTWHAALADPALPSMLLSEDIARPVYERMGYLPLLRLTLWYRGRPR